MRCASLLLLALGVPAWAVTYTTVPLSVAAGSAAFELTINRSFSAGDEGYSPDEMSTFTWQGPTNPNTRVSIGPARLVSVTQVKLDIPASLLSIAGPVTIRYIADPSDTREERVISFLITAGGPVSITTTSLPIGLRNASFSTTLQATAGTPLYSWALIAGSLPAGLNLSVGGLISGTPTASGTFNLIVRVSDSVSTTDVRAFALVIQEMGVACSITPENASLGLHFPSWHVGTPATNPDHLVAVDVVVDAAAARSIPVLLTASHIAFATASGILPTLSSSTVTTDTNGRALFVINPPGPDLFDETDLEATGTVGGRTFRCNSSATTGMGMLGHLFVNPAPLPRPSISAMAAALLGPLRGLAEMFGMGGGSNAPATLVAQAHPPPILQRDAEEAVRQLLDQVRLNLRRESSPAAVRVRQLAEAGAEPSHTSPQARLRFAKNEGQFAKDIAYSGSGNGYQVAVNHSEIQLLANSKSTGEPPIRIHFGGAATPGTVEAGAVEEGKSHFLIGPRDAWLTDIRQFGEVTSRQVFPGIDAVLHDRGGNLEVDFAVTPGADPKAIDLRFEGIRSLEIDATGDLLLHTRGHTVRLERPFVYQEVAALRKPARGEFRIAGKDRVSFEIGEYDQSKPIVIDPVISFADFVGGTATDAASAIAVDSQGNIYIAGGTTSADFPVANSIQKSALGPGADVFVTKFDPTGTKVLYSTFVGGVGMDAAFGIAVDAQGSAYVVGNTSSPDFPTVKPYQGSLHTAQGSLTDAFIFKLSPSGSSLVYSTFLGGSKDEVARGIAVDGNGNAIVTGGTSSNDFPVKNAFQTSLRGTGIAPMNAFVAKLNAAGSDLVYSSFLGGSGPDIAHAIAIDAAGNAYLTGATESAAFPTLLPLQATNRGGQDIFVTKVNAAGALVYSTYLGGRGDDAGHGIAVDPAGAAYITGITGSATFPLVNPAQAKFGSTNSIGLDAFVAKLPPDGRGLVYSTFLGGSGVDMGLSIAVGSDGSAHVAGETTSSDFPAVGALNTLPAGSVRAFVTKVNPAGAAFTYSTTLGGGRSDSASAIAVNASGVYLAGTTESADFPASYGGAQGRLRGRANAFLAKLADGSPVPSFITIHAATFLTETGGATEAIVTGFGNGLATGNASNSSSNLPISLLGVSVNIKDSAGKEVAAPLLFVSPGQINYLVPAGLAAGLAAVTVRNGTQTVATGTLLLQTVAPGLFTANANGLGAPAALSLRVTANNVQTSKLVYTCGAAAGSCVPDPIDFGASTDGTYLLLFGTGIRGRGALTGVTASVGGLNVPVLSAGAQSEFPGLDQVNIGPLPRSLAGRGKVDLILKVDGKQTNVVSVSFK